MHSAPAVTYPVGRSHFHAALVALIALAGLATMGCWLQQADAIGARYLVAVALWLTSSGLAAWQVWHAPAGILTWDGLGWTWTCAELTQSVVLEVTLDLQAYLVLRLHVNGDKRRLWAWPEMRTSPLRWLTFRRAVFGKMAAQADLTDPAGLVASARMPP